MVKDILRFILVGFMSYLGTTFALDRSLDKLHQHYAVLLVHQADANYVVKDIDAERAEHDYQRTVAKTIPKRGHKR